MTILKPLHGDEPGLAANLARFCVQDYPGPVAIVFGVQRDDDPAVAVAQAVMAAHPTAGCSLVRNSRRHGQNGKIGNLINMEPAIGHAIVVLADSDMVVENDYLRRIVEALVGPRGRSRDLSLPRPRPAVRVVAPGGGAGSISTFCRTCCSA